MQAYSIVLKKRKIKYTWIGTIKGNEDQGWSL